MFPSRGLLSDCTVIEGSFPALVSNHCVHSGYVKSFNYDQGIHLANQQYTACVRQEMGYCTIAWSSVSTTR